MDAISWAEAQLSNCDNPNLRELLHLAKLGRTSEKQFLDWVNGKNGSLCSCNGIYKKEPCVLLWDEECPNKNYCKLREVPGDGNNPD